MLAAIAAVLIAVVVWVAWSNTAIELNTYIIASSRLPESFNGYRIAHVSDLHNAQIGTDNEKLLTLLKEANPDMIAITGDLIDSRNTNVDIALQFVKEAVKIAPCYYVTGNHEARINAYSELRNGLTSAGVTVLEDTSVNVDIDGAI